VKLSAILAPLIDSKADHETIRKIVLAFEAEQADALERRRESDRKRQAAKAERDRQSRDSRERDGAGSSREGVTRVEDKTSTQKIEPQQEERNALAREFAEFWTECPNKVGKPKAKAAFGAARKRASFEAIMAGLRRYIASKPADRAWLNPQTFLNQDRWDDQPAAVLPLARAGPAAQPNLSQIYATKERMERERDLQQLEPAEAAIRYLPAANG
jgi:hypothetical protein